MCHDCATDTVLPLLPVAYWCFQCGCMPFAVLEQRTLAERIQRLSGDMQQMRFQVPDRLSEGAQDMLKQLLHPDPKQRIDTAGEA